MKQDILFSLRRIKRNRFGTLVNVLGLTVGIFVSLALISFFLQETSVDHFHNKADRIYKAISRVRFSEETEEVLSISLGTLSESLVLNFEEVEATARLYGPEIIEIDVEEERFNGLRLLQVDYSFFRLFDYPGIDHRLFKSPNDAIISQETANKLFAGNPIGQQIKVLGKNYIVRGVTLIPSNTVFKFDVALPLESMSDFEDMVAGGLEFETYVCIKEQANATELVRQLSEHYNSVMQAKWPSYEAANFFIPLKDTYINNAGVYNRLGNGDMKLLTIVISVAIVVLLLALINYVNLQIANNHARKFELRLKKILGANRFAIFKQQVVESILTLLFASVLASVLLEVFYHSPLASLFGKNTLTLKDWRLEYWIFLFASILIISVVVGIIPSLKSFSRTSLTQQALTESKLSTLTLVLVTCQFLITSSLLIGVLFINEQMGFLKEQPMGYDSEQVVVIDNLNEEFKKHYDLLQQKLNQIPEIISVGAAQSAPGSSGSGQIAYRTDQLPEDGIQISHIRTMGGYVQTLGLTMLEGTDFTPAASGNTRQFILNELAAQQLFKEGEPVAGSSLYMSGRKGEVVGVVENYHLVSLKQMISPLILTVEDPYDMTLLIKLRRNDSGSALDKIRKTLEPIDSKYVFDYHFLDDRFANIYRTELQTKKIISYASTIAIVISLMGLLSLSLFVINAQIKEIAIRKILGGSPQHLFARLSYLLLLCIVAGNLLALPISYFIASKWLQEFIYQVSTHHLLWMCALSTVLTILVGFLIVMKKIRQAISVNPVEFLKSE